MEIRKIIWYRKLSSKGWRITGAPGIITGNPLGSVHYLWQGGGWVICLKFIVFFLEAPQFKNLKFRDPHFHF